MRLGITLGIALAALVSAAPAWAQTPAPSPAAAVASPSPEPTMPAWVTQTIDMEVCNQTGSFITIALAYPNDKTEASRGWWPVKDGECSKLGKFPINHQRVAIYANARDGRFSSETRAWSGNLPYCVKLTSAFTFQDGFRKGGGLCPNEGETRNFIPITPAMLWPADTEKQNQPNLAFKYTFRK
jgi:uncharacterized membrane protein